MNLPLGGTQKLMKPFCNNQPTKLFAKCNSSQYNSQKNLRNTGTLANNRYSSQNMKSFEYDGEENDQDEDFGLEVAEENLPIYNNTSANQRRASQRFKDRVRSLRVQSQETCAREGNPGMCKSEGSEDPFEPFDRAPNEGQDILSKQNQPKTHLININQFDGEKGKGGIWTQPISLDEEETPKIDDHYDEMSGAHFQFNELLKKLKEIKKVKKEKQSGQKGKRKSLNKMSNNETQDIQREPLKEKNVESVNQQQNLFSEQKKKPSLDGKQRRGGLNSTGNGKATQRHGLKLSQSKQTQQQQNDKSDKNKLNKLILTNQENNFIEKRLKDQNTQPKKKISTKVQNPSNNKSQASLQKSCEKNVSKSGQQSQGCVINNMKVKQSSHPNIASDSQLQQKQSFSSQNSKNGHPSVKIPQAPQINATISNVISSNMIPASSNNVPISNFGAGIKCPSANILKTGNTAISSNRKSTMMTQSSSNKQFQTRDTPEASQKQKLRLGIGTSCSSNSKLAAATTSSGSNNGNGYVPSNFQTTNLQHDSVTKRSQNSDSKHSKHESLGNRSSSNTTQKTEIKKMMIKTQNMMKQNQKVMNQQNKNQNEFYQTIFQKIQNNNFLIPTSQIVGSGMSSKKEIESCIEKKKNSLTGGSARVQKIQNKVNPQRLSGQGSNHASVNSPGTMDLKSIESSPNQSWTRRSSTNNREMLPQKQNQNPMSMQQVNQIIKKLQDQTQPLVKSQKPKTVTQGPAQQSILLSHQLKKQTMNQINRHQPVKYPKHSDNYLNRNNSQEYMFKNFQNSGKSSDNNLIRTLEIDKKILLEQQMEERQMEGQTNDKKAELMGKFLVQKKQELNQIQRPFTNAQMYQSSNQKKGLLIANIMMQNGIKNKTRQGEKLYMQTQDHITDDGINVGDILKYTSIVHDEDQTSLRNGEIPPQLGHRLSQRVKVKQKLY